MLVIRITKRPDGSGLLECVHADGSTTWQKQGRHAGYFALHDLTHFAVESTLGFQQGFYGLIAAGWDIEDTTGKGSRGALPAEAIEVEHLVGTFQAESAGGTLWTADEFNACAAMQAAGRAAPRRLTDDDLARVRAKRASLFSQWFALEPGGTLELKFGES
jgi:hypothetical protein